jgi:aspartyl-tRNA(Asn)/glutamyl-tRNA(Gln) amidotransferase subunit C
MAKLSAEDVLKLAKLCRLELTEHEIEKFSDEIGAILDYVEQLQSVDVTNIEPTLQVTGLVNATREDKIIDYGTTPHDLLHNAPAVEEGHIKVKRMLA